MHEIISNSESVIENEGLKREEEFQQNLTRVEIDFELTEDQK